MDTHVITEDLNKLIEDAKKLNLISEAAKKTALKVAEFPKFYMPEWPNLDFVIEIGLGLRRPLFLNKDIQTGFYRPRKKVVVIDLNIVNIDGKGIINITCGNPLDLEDQIKFHSNDKDPFGRINCLVIFSQYIEEILLRARRKIRKIMISRNNCEKEEIERVLEAAKKSFEPLVPFILADRLLGEKR